MTIESILAFLFLLGICWLAGQLIAGMFRRRWEAHCLDEIERFIKTSRKLLEQARKSDASPEEVAHLWIETPILLALCKGSKKYLEHLRKSNKMSWIWW